MACLVKILQIKSVIPHLIQRRPVKSFLSNLELNHKYNRRDKQNNINPASHPRNIKFKE